MCSGIKAVDLIGIGWKREFVTTVKSKTLEINRKAFKAGIEV